MLKVKALLFDVFGTVVDWRTGIAREVESIADKNHISLDPFDFFFFVEARLLDLEPGGLRYMAMIPPDPNSP